MSSNTQIVNIAQTCAIMMDANNIELSIKSEFKSKDLVIDFDVLIPKLLSGRGLRTFDYFREGTTISEKLAHRLQEKYYGTVVPCGKSVDIKLCIRCIEMIGAVDTIILLSGDKDYLELIHHLRSRGVRVELAGVESTTAAILKKEVNSYYKIQPEDCYRIK